MLLHCQGYQIPRGWAVTYSIRETHDRSPLFSADANCFNPDRWMSLVSPDQTILSSGFQYVPFGAGARACIGRHYAMMFARTFCIELVRACRRWQLTTPLPVSMLKVPVICPRDKLYAVFEPNVV